MGLLERTCWPYSMNHRSTSLLSMSDLGLGSRDTEDGPQPQLSGTAGEPGYVTLPSQYRVPGQWESGATSKAQRMPSRKRDFLLWVRKNFREKEALQLCLDVTRQRKLKKRLQAGRPERAA